MFGRNTLFVCIGILALSSAYLMGQESWSPSLGPNCLTLSLLPASPDKAILGDSVLALHKVQDCNSIGQELSLLQGENILDKSACGARVVDVSGSTIIDTIPEQYTAARGELGPDLKTLILNGGAVDVSLDSMVCGVTPETWISVDQSIVALSDLFETARNDGVEKMVYMGIWIPVERLDSGCDFRVFSEVLNYGMDRARELAAPYDDVIFVDTRDFMSPANPEWQRSWLENDGAHPSPEGADAVAHFIHDTVGFD